MSRSAPRVRGRQSPMDKAPWLHVPPPSGPVEAEFLRPLLLGESIAPFRQLDTVLAVIPTSGIDVLDARSASDFGHRHLAAWLRDAETKWEANSSRKGDGRPRITLRQQIDHMRKLSQQLGATGPKVAYTKAGTRLSAVAIEDSTVVVDHKAYWASVRSPDEARYLCAIINSDTVLQRVIPMQPRGWRDPRDFDNLVWELPIPEFDGGNELHRHLAAAGAEAERIAAAVLLPDGDYRRKRRTIREALAAAGHAAVMEELVAALLAQ